MQITTSDRVIINWQDFSINSGELTKFLQPGASSAALNRVISANPSSLLGSLQANGQIYLINPNGIMVGPGASINCASFIASTLDVANSQFMAGGNLNFTGNSTACIQNFGNISASGGDILLMAHKVENSGTLSAPNGTVGLGAGQEFILSQSGSEQMLVRPTTLEKKTGGGTGILNRGTIAAAQAELKAHGNIYAFAINNEGVIRANGVTTKNGRVLLTADSGVVANSGTISARDADGKGGQIDMTGPDVRINGGLIDASGETGGGQVRIGGEYQGGKNLTTDELANAQTVGVAQGAQIKADATGETGDGGTVILWADEKNAFYGDISAKPGTSGGKGGFVEISSGDQLAYGGTVQTGGGSILFDPKNITISSGGTTLSGDLLFATDPALDYTITASSLVSLLSSPNNVVLQANNDIVVNAALVVNNPSGNGGNLALQAGRSILINANITTDSGALTLAANFGASNGVVDAQRDAGAANITMASGTTINAGSADVIVDIRDGMGNTYPTSGNITLDNITTSGNIFINSVGPTAGSSILRAQSTSLLSAGGWLALRLAGMGGGGSIGAAGSPIRISTPILEAAGQSGGIRISSPSSGFAIGGGSPPTAITGIETAGAGAIEISAAGAITQTESVSSTGTVKFELAGYNLNLSGPNAMTTLSITAGSATVVQNTTLDLGGCVITGNLSVTCGNPITDSGALVVGGTASFSTTAGNANIVLDSTGNAFSGTLTLSPNGTGSASVINSVGTILGGTSIGGGLNLSSGGAVTQTAALNVTGSVNIGAGSHDITLENTGNTFGTLALTGNNVSITENAATDLGSCNIGGNLTVNSAGAITDSGTLTVTGAGSFTSTGTSASGDITLDSSASSFGSVGLHSANGMSVSLVMVDGITLNACNATGYLTISSSGAITQNGALAVGGAATFASGSNQSITLNNQANEFLGTVVLTPGGTGNASLYNTTDAQLGGGSFGGNLTVTSLGDISQSAALIVSGTATFSVPLASGNVTLSNSGNDFGSVSVNGHSVYVCQSGAMNIGSSVVTDYLSLYSMGDITQSGAIIAGGLTAQGGAITLTNPGNSIGALSSISRDGAFSLYSIGNLEIEGSLSSGNIVNPVTIQIAGGNLTIASEVAISTSGNGNDIILATDNALINNAGSSALTTSGGRFLVYCKNTSANVFGGLPYDFQEYGVSYPTPPLSSHTGNGFLFRPEQATPVVDPTTNPEVIIFENNPNLDNPTLNNPVTLFADLGTAAGTLPFTTMTDGGPLAGTTPPSTEGGALAGGSSFDLAQNTQPPAGGNQGQNQGQGENNGQPGTPPAGTNTGAPPPGAPRNENIIPPGTVISLSGSGFSSVAPMSIPPLLQQAISPAVQMQLQNVLQTFGGF
ncbi:MAG: filamentous hemagglutinin N-terminal domain-containing protein [Verrucomicrobiae bacterium]|nr:filamentous hemagglutinin N-terminal domain-containing protein [Verrucomicrobiae bacterium]